MNAHEMFFWSSILDQLGPPQAASINHDPHNYLEAYMLGHLVQAIHLNHVALLTNDRP